MQLSDRQTKAISTIKTLPQFEGWNDDDVAKNLSEVFSSDDPKRKSNAVTVMKSLSAFEGWDDNEIQNNLSDVFKNSPIYVDPVPTGETGQKGYAQVFEIPEQTITAERDETDPLYKNPQSKRLREHLATQRYFRDVEPLQASVTDEDPLTTQRREFLNEFANTRGGNIPFFNPIETIGTLNAVEGAVKGASETAKNISEGKGVDALISGLHTGFSAAMSTPSAIPFNVAIKALETASPKATEILMKPVSYTIDQIIPYAFEQKFGRPPTEEELAITKERFAKNIPEEGIMTGKQTTEILDVIGNFILLKGFHKATGKLNSLRKPTVSEGAEYNRLKSESRVENLEQGGRERRLNDEIETDLQSEMKREYQEPAPIIEQPKPKEELPSLLVDAKGKPIPIQPVREARAPLREGETENFRYEGDRTVPIEENRFVSDNESSSKDRIVKPEKSDVSKDITPEQKRALIDHGFTVKELKEKSVPEKLKILGEENIQEPVSKTELPPEQLANLTKELPPLPIEKPIETAPIQETGSPKLEATSNFQKEADALGLTFNGMQERPKGKHAIPLFTDKQTGTTFTLNEGETLSEALARKRKEFEPAIDKKIAEGKITPEQGEFKPKELQKIKSAAVQTPDGTIYTGKWHPEAYEKYMKEKGISKDEVISEVDNGTIKDGFLTSDGKFVSRDEAAKIASQSKQFREGKEGDIAFAGGLKNLESGTGIIKPKSSLPVFKSSEEAISFGKTATPEQGKPKESVAPTGDLVETPLSEINTDTKRFQNRSDNVDESVVSDMVENFDRQRIKLNPAVLWKDENGKTFVLAGHHRLEASKRVGEKSIPSIEFKGTEAEAIKYAKDSNNQSRPKNLLDRAKIYREQRAKGVDEKQIKKNAVIEYDNKNPVLALSFLNPEGKALQNLQALTKGGGKSASDASIMAQWIGEIKAQRPEITKIHENEIYDFLKDEYGKGDARTKTLFKEKIDRHIERNTLLGKFETDKPLNLKSISGRSALEAELAQKIDDANARVKELDGKIAKQHSLIGEQDTPTRRKELSLLTAEVIKARKTYNDLKLGESDAKSLIRKSEQSLFDEVSDEQLSRVERRTTDEVEKSEPTITALENQEKLARETKQVNELKNKVDAEIEKIIGQKVSTEQPPEVKKTKDFKTGEGNFSVYDIEKDVRGRGDMFTVLKDKNGYVIRNAFVPEKLQRKGIATEFYKKMNEESLTKTGKPLRSTKERTLSTGEKVHELSKDAIALWDSFVDKGLAEKLGGKNYRFKQPSQEAGKVKKIPLDEEKSELVDMDGIPIETNPDGTVTLYHRTTEKNVNEIKKSGRFKSLENTNEAFFSNKKEGQAEGYGDAIVEIKINPKHVRLNDAFHKGEIHVAIPVNRISSKNIVSDIPVKKGDTGFGKGTAKSVVLGTVNLATNKIINDSDLDDDTKQKLSTLVTALTVAGLGTVLMSNKAKETLAKIRESEIAKTLGEKITAEKLSFNIRSATQKFLNSDEAKLLSKEDRIAMHRANLTGEFAKNVIETAQEARANAPKINVEKTNKDYRELVEERAKLITERSNELGIGILTGKIRKGIELTAEEKESLAIMREKMREKGTKVAGLTQRINTLGKNEKIEGFKDANGVIIDVDKPTARNIRIEEDFAKDAEKLKDLSKSEKEFYSMLDPLRAANKIDDVLPSKPVHKHIYRPTDKADFDARKEVFDTKHEFEKLLNENSIKEFQPLHKGIVIGKSGNKFPKTDIEIPDISKKVTPESERIMDFLEGNDVKLSAEEMNVQNYMRGKYDSWLDRVNKERADVNLPPIPKRKNYATHVQELGIIEDFYGSLASASVPSDILASSKFIKPNSPFNQFFLQRKGGEYAKDAIGAFNAYYPKIVRNIHLTKPVTEAREYVKHLPPNAREYFDNYLTNNIVGKTHEFDKAMGVLGKISTRLGWRIARNLLIASPKIVAQQTSSHALTYAMTNPLRASRGLIKAMTPEGWNFAKENSEVYQRRVYEGIEELHPGTFKKVEGALATPLEMADKFSVVGAFNAGFEYAKAKGMSFEEAVKFGDDIAYKTQASMSKAHKPPIMRSQVASSSIGQFQTFSINAWNAIWRDVMANRVDANKTIPQKVASRIYKVGAILGVATAVNKAFEELGLDPPYGAGSFVPFYNAAVNFAFFNNDEMIKKLGSNEKFGASAVVTTTRDLANAMTNMIFSSFAEDEDKKEALDEKTNESLKRALFKVVPPFGGQQALRTGEGYFATQDGVVKDKKGNVLFKIEGSPEQVRTMFNGKWGSKAAKEYFEQRDIKEDENSEVKVSFQKQLDENVKSELKNLDIDREPPKRKYNDVELSFEEHKKLTSEYVKIFNEHMNELINDDSWGEMSEDLKKKRITQAKKAALEQAKGEAVPDLQERIQEEIEADNPFIFQE